MTSSVVAMMGGKDKGKDGNNYNEQDWTDENTSVLYDKSKVLAEKEARRIA